MSDGFVYFIKEKETGNIKIGFSEKHPKGRLKDFQTGNSNKLILLGYIEGTKQDESNLHHEFSEERKRNRNEWFKPSPRLKDKIKELLKEALEDKENEINVLNLKSGTAPNYVGERKGEKYDGHGTFTYPNGDKYEGEWKEGKEHGQGTKTYPNGDKYEGEWKDGEYHKGMITYYSSRYKCFAEFKDAKPWKGTTFRFDGNITGTYTNGKWRLNDDPSKTNPFKL